MTMLPLTFNPKKLIYMPVNKLITDTGPHIGFWKGGGSMQLLPTEHNTFACRCTPFSPLVY